MPWAERDGAVFRQPLAWIVAFRRAPFYVRENPTERAWQAIVLERETELILAQEFATGASPDMAVRLVRGALSEPMAGPKRRPACIVVEDPNLGAILSAEFEIKIEVSDRPMPEIDLFLDEFKRHLDAGGGQELREARGGESEPSYFDGALSPPAIQSVITAGSALAKLRPWDRFPNSQLIRVDIPELGVREAGVIIIGRLAESRSILFFRSRDDYMVHLGRGERLANQPPFSIERVHPGIPILALDFESALDVSSRIKAEARAMGLRPGRNTLYPRVLCMDPDGVRRPPSEHDLRLVVALATALVETLRQCGRRLGDPDSWPICAESKVGEAGVVRLTVPFEAGSLFGVNEAPSSAPAKPGILAAGEALADAENADENVAALEAMTLLLAVADTQLEDAGREIERAIRKDDGDSLATPWALFHRFPKNLDITVAEALLGTSLLSKDAADWIEAQCQSWISAWHIADGSRDRFSCRDVITGEIRVFVEADPRTRGRLAQGDVFLGRIVDFERGPVIFGAGAYTLSLRSAGLVADSVRRALKTAQVTPAMLRSHRGGFVVQREWNKAAGAQRSR
jgi:hypothetical protein